MLDALPVLPPHIVAAVEELVQHWRDRLPHPYRQWPKAQRERMLAEMAADVTRMLSIYTWSIHALQAALAEYAPGLAAGTIIARTDYDWDLGHAIVLVWTIEDEEATRRAVQAIASRMHVYVYSGPAAALDLGLSPRQWQPLWKRYAFRDHVVVCGESEVLSASVDYAQRWHRDERREIAALLQACRESLPNPGLAAMMYATIVRFWEQAEQVVQDFLALPAGTPLPESQAVLYKDAVIQRDIFGCGREMIEQNREQWEQADAFDHLVLLAIERMFEVMPLYSACLGKHWQGEASLWPTLATAGLVRSMMKLPLGPAFSMSDNSRLARVLDAEAGGNRDARNRKLNEMIAGAVPVALAQWQVLEGESISANLKRLRNAVVGLVEHSGAGQGEKTNTWVIERLTDEAADASVNGLQEWQALEEAMLQQDLRAVYTEARLTPQQIAVMELDEQGYKDREIAAMLGIHLGSVAKQKNRATTRLRDYYQRMKEAG